MIFVDRSIPRSIARALQLVRDDVIWLEDRYPHNSKDPTWLEDAGRNDWIVLSRDKRIRHRKYEVNAIREHGVGAFIIGEKQDISRWNLLRIVVSKLDDIEQVFTLTERPFIYLIDAGGSLRRVL
jgi:hypothetical protein